MLNALWVRMRVARPISTHLLGATKTGIRSDLPLIPDTITDSNAAMGVDRTSEPSHSAWYDKLK